MEDDGDDDFFREVYGKEYAGPPRLPSGNSQDVQRDSKRPLQAEDYDADNGGADPYAVPTDFTSREAKVWEAKAKAIERNWNRRKEEEMICKICGESGHFTQGCPSTLGGGKKFADFFERVAARDKRVKALFSDAVISRLEKEIGCKIRMDEKFIFVSGKDRLILAKGVDAVHKLIQEGKEDDDRSKSPPKNSQKSSKSKSPERSPPRPQSAGREARSTYPSHRDPTQVVHQRKGFSSQERFVEDRAREGSHKFSRDSPEAHGKNGVKRRQAAPSNSDVAGNHAFSNNAYDAVHKRATAAAAATRTDRWDTETPIGKQPDFATYPQTMEELEAEFKRQAAEMRMQHDKEEAEEKSRYQERIRKLRAGLEGRMEAMRVAQAKRREEFLRAEVQRRMMGWQQMAWYAATHGRSGSGSGSGDARGAMYAAMNVREAYPEFPHSRREELARAAAYGGGGAAAMVDAWGGMYTAAGAAAAMGGTHDSYIDRQLSRREDNGRATGYGGGPAAAAAMDAAWGGMYAAMSPHEGYAEFQHSTREDRQRGEPFGGGGGGRY
ncbi:uncharacterized protein LOC144712274 isoform X2 [Wolffia australiana]